MYDMTHDVKLVYVAGYLLLRRSFQISEFKHLFDCSYISYYRRSENTASMLIYVQTVEGEFLAAVIIS